mgnify:CR=1 FL=1
MDDITIGMIIIFVIFIDRVVMFPPGVYLTNLRE